MAWNVLQSALFEGTGGITQVTMSATFPNNLTAGSVLLALSTVFGSSPTMTASDGNGNSFTQIAYSHETSEPCDSALFALATPAGDAGTKPTISITNLNGANDGYCAMMIQEVAGISATPDGTAATASTSGTVAGPLGPPSYTSSTANEYLLYTFADDGFAVTVTPPAGYSVDPNSALTPATTCCIALGYKNSTGGPESGQWNWTSSDAVNLIMVAFPVTGGPPVTPAYYQMRRVGH